MSSFLQLSECDNSALKFLKDSSRWVFVLWFHCNNHHKCVDEIQVNCWTTVQFCSWAGCLSHRFPVFSFMWKQNNFTQEGDFTGCTCSTWQQIKCFLAALRCITVPLSLSWCKNANAYVGLRKNPMFGFPPTEATVVVPTWPNGSQNPWQQEGWQSNTYHT